MIPFLADFPSLFSPVTFFSLEFASSPFPFLFSFLLLQVEIPESVKCAYSSPFSLLHTIVCALCPTRRRPTCPSSFSVDPPLFEVKKLEGSWISMSMPAPSFPGPSFSTPLFLGVNAGPLRYPLPKAFFMVLFLTSLTRPLPSTF